MVARGLSNRLIVSVLVASDLCGWTALSSRRGQHLACVTTRCSKQASQQNQEQTLQV